LFVFCPVGQNYFLMRAHAIQNDGFSFHGILYLLVTASAGFPPPIHELAMFAQSPVLVVL
jgi:hypothetical protein